MDDYLPETAPRISKSCLGKKLHADKTLEIDDICRTLRISRSTFYRYVRLVFHRRADAHERKYHRSDEHQPEQQETQRQ